MRIRNLAGLLSVVAILVLIVSLLPLRTAFELGGDEGYEVIKPFLVNHGYALYKDIWNDQPPVSTVLLCAAFKTCGTSILTARLFGAAFGLLLIVSFHELIRARSGPWAALLAALFLITAPGVLLLGVSVMLEVPAFATGLLSAWLLYQWGRHRHWAWLLASGGVMAFALQIKLTAALLVPALLVELALTAQDNRPAQWRRNLILNALLWGTAFAVVFVAIGLTWAEGSLASSWKSHSTMHASSPFGRIEDYTFQSQLLWNHIEAVLGAFVGLGIAFRRKRLREIAFPAILLLTAAAIHTVHRPWWDYYYLHLAIPVAWLTGWAAYEIIQTILRLHSANRFNLASKTTWRILALCGLVALAMAKSERRLEANWKDLRQRPSADANPIVQRMKTFASRTKWAYSESGIYPFHARLLVPPELAIVMPKRFWSDQISISQIIETCKRYQTEQIVLRREAVNGEWKAFLDAGYQMTSTDGKHVHYVAKRLLDQPAP